MEEVASVIISYGGYILKYVGDTVLGFFVVQTKYAFENNVVQYDTSYDHVNDTDQKDYLKKFLSYTPDVDLDNVLIIEF